MYLRVIFGKISHFAFSLYSGHQFLPFHDLWESVFMILCYSNMLVFPEHSSNALWFTWWIMMTEDFITLFTSFSLVHTLYKPGWSLADSLRNISIPLLILSVQGSYRDLGEGLSISYTVCRQACCHKSSSNWTPKWQVPGIHTEPVSFLKRISET